MSDLNRLASKVARALADQGKLVEAGWTLLRVSMFSDRTEDEIARLRDAYFIGAQHVFSSMIGMLSDEDEVTEADMRRMDSLQVELNNFTNELFARRPELRRQ